MTTVKSNHDTDLRLPQGPMLRAGKSVNVENWGVVKGHDIVKAWLAAGAIEKVAEIVPDPVEEPKSKASKSKPVEE